MYSVKELLNKEPAAVKATFVALATAVLLTGDWNIDGEVVAGWGLAIELVLGLFYVRRATVSKMSLSELAEAEEAQADQSSSDPPQGEPGDAS